MSDASTNVGVGKSLSDIAKMMADTREARMKAVTEEEVTQPNEVEDDETIDEGATEDADDLVEEDADDQDDADATEDDDTTEDDADDAEEAGSDDQYDEIEISDDDLVEIDGEDEPVSLKTLKETYTADKTIARNVEEAQADRQEAQQSLNKALDESRRVKEAMKHVVESIDSILAQPLVNRPNETLKQTNPAQYIAQLEAYEQDQQRINQTRQAIYQAVEAHEKAEGELKQSRQVASLARLTERLPDLRIEGKKKEVFTDIASAAMSYGFNENDLKEAAGDDRLLHMAYDAAQYRKLKAGSNSEQQQEKVVKLKQATKGPRVMRSKGTSSKKIATAQAKRIKVLKNKAQSTGKTDDVAQFMSARRQTAT